MPTVYTAAMEIDTRYHPDQALAAPATWQAKCGLLDQALIDARTGFTQLNQGAPPGQGDLQVFAAPEYLFGLPLGNTDSSVNAYDESTRDFIRSHLAAASSNHPNMLIIAGTVLYKRLVGRVERGTLAANLAQGATNFAPGSATQTEIQKAAQQVSLKGKGLKHSFKKKVLKMASGKLYGFNEALVFHRGNEVLCLKKADNANEFSAEDPKPTLIPGTGFGTFNYPGTNVVVGVEICADSGRLKSGGQKVNVQVLIAATKPMANQDIVTDQGQLVLIVNAQPSYTNKPNGGYIVTADQDGLKLDRQQGRQAQQQAPKIGRVRCQVFNI